MSFEKVFPTAKTTPVSDEFDISATLGEGSFAVVKKGVKKSTKQSFAVKYISKANFDGDLEELGNEVHLMLDVMNSPYVVRLVDVYESEKDLILILDLISGGELFEKIVQKGTYSEADTSKVMKQILLGLMEIHAKNIIHRDLKPENLLCVSPDINAVDDVKIADFGESIKLPEDELAIGLRGSPSYIAPEIWLEEPYGPKADMWSLGVVAFILLGGYLPFEEPDPDDVEAGKAEDKELSEIVIAGKYKFEEDAWNDVSDTAKDFVKKLLVVDPEKRLSSAEALMHSFIMGSSSTKARTKALDSLKNFNAKRKWQSVAEVVMAANKLKRLSAFGSEKAKKTSKSRIKRIFDQADKDGSGSLDKEELRSVLRKIFRKSDVSFDSKQMRKYAALQIAEHDSDGSGTIDFEEFAELYQKIMDDPEIPDDLKKGAKTSEKEQSSSKSKSRSKKSSSSSSSTKKKSSSSSSKK